MLGKDLKVGMLTTFGLVLDVIHDGNHPDGIWEGPHVHWMEVQDPHWGAVSSSLKLDEEHEILYAQGTPKYREEVKKMISARADSITYAKKDIDDLIGFL